MNVDLCEKLFSVLADRNRLSMLALLSERSMTVTEIYTSLGIEQSLASHHLRLLKECGFVRCRVSGKNRVYSINRKTVFPVIKIMERHGYELCALSTRKNLSDMAVLDSIEHETDLIMERIEMLKAQIKNIESKGAANRVRRIIKLFRDDIEIHFIQEEEVLFPALGRKKISRTLLKTLAMEHKMLRLKLDELEMLAKGGGSKKVERIKEASKELEEMLKIHLRKEDNILLPKAKSSLSKDEIKMLNAAMHNLAR